MNTIIKISCHKQDLCNENRRKSSKNQSNLIQRIRMMNRKNNNNKNNSVNVRSKKYHARFQNTNKKYKHWHATDCRQAIQKNQTVKKKTKIGKTVEIVLDETLLLSTNKHTLTHAYALAQLRARTYTHTLTNSFSQSVSLSSLSLCVLIEQLNICGRMTHHHQK